MRIMRHYPQISVQRPKKMILFWLALMGVMAIAIVLWPQIQINPTFKSMIMPNDRDRAFDLESKKTFGDDEVIIIAVEHSESVFNIDTLAKIDRITRKVRELDGVRDIFSLTYIDNIRDRGGVLDTSDLIEELPRTAEELARIEKEAEANPVYWNSIVSPDKKVGAINVELSLERSDTRSRGELTEKILSIAREENKQGEEKIYVTGFPVSSYFGGIYMITDMVIFGGVATVLLVIILWFIFRNAQGVVFTLLVGMLGVSVTYGAMSLAGVQITMPLSAVMVFVMALGMEYSIYVGYAYITEVIEERNKGRAIRDFKLILSEGVRRVYGAVALSAVTTAIGFLSMLTNPVPDLARMGLFLAIGTMTVGLASVTVVPAVIALWPFEVKARAEPRRLTNRVVMKIGGGAARHPGRAILVMGVLLSLCFVGWVQMSLDTDAMQYFKKDDKIRTDEEFVRARMAGTTYLQAVVTAGERDAFKKPDNLNKLIRLQDYAQSLPHVTKAISHADHVRLLHRALRGEDEAYTIPDKQAAVEQLLMLHKEPDDFRMVIDFEYRKASVMVRMDTMSSSELKRVEEQLETRMKELFPDMDGNVVGTTLLVHRAFDMMASSMLTGLGIACGLIWLIMCVVFRSVKLGTLALLPNIVPIALIYSVLGWIGYPLDPPTAVTGAIALGIAVDDTIHFFKTWLHHARFESMSSPDAVVATLNKIGRPMVMSSMVLALGFGVMVLSSYGTLLWLGVMLCIGAVSGLVCDLLLTPAILSLARPGAAKPAAEELESFKKIDNTVMDPERQRMSQYSDDEIERMHAYDFFAIAGKTVIRHGGNYGTRRLLYEMQLEPGLKILEIGAGKGATAFTLAASHGCHVTCIELNAYMLEVARQTAEELGITHMCEFVLASKGSMPFEDDSFDAVICESVVMYAGTEAIFGEVFRVLKPGGVLGFHDWSWTHESMSDMQGIVNNMACYCDLDEARFYTVEQWRSEVERFGFDTRFSAQYPFAYFSMLSMIDDEGALNVARMFGRLLGRKKALAKMLSIMAFLDRYQHAFTYTLIVGRKPAELPAGDEARATATV